MHLSVPANTYHADSRAVWSGWLRPSKLHAPLGSCTSFPRARRAGALRSDKSGATAATRLARAMLLVSIACRNLSVAPGRSSGIASGLAVVTISHAYRAVEHWLSYRTGALVPSQISQHHGQLASRGTTRCSMSWWQLSVINSTADTRAHSVHIADYTTWCPAY